MNRGNLWGDYISFGDSYETSKPYLDPYDRYRIRTAPPEEKQGDTFLEDGCEENWGEYEPEDNSPLRKEPDYMVRNRP